MQFMPEVVCVKIPHVVMDNVAGLMAFRQALVVVPGLSVVEREGELVLASPSQSKHDQDQQKGSGFRDHGFLNSS